MIKDFNEFTGLNKVNENAASADDLQQLLNTHTRFFKIKPGSDVMVVNMQNNELNASMTFDMARQHIASYIMDNIHYNGYDRLSANVATKMVDVYIDKLEHGEAVTFFDLSDGEKDYESVIFIPLK